MNACSLTEIRKKHRKISYLWGFRWAVLMAVCWGMQMMPSGATWFEAPLTEMPLLMGAVMLTALTSLFILIFMLISLACNDKLKEYWLTLKNFKKVSFWYFVAAILGGPIAYFGLYLATGYVGPVFATIAALTYPVFGSVTARIWYKERINKRCALSMFIIIMGGMALYAPDIVNEFASGMGEGSWLGYIGGLMTAVGWGLEGAVAGRVLDVTDSDVGVAIRYTAEPIYWFLIIVPLVNLNFPVFSSMGQALNNNMLLLMIVMTALATCCVYLSWYKSFPLVGVTRGQTITATSGIFVILFSTIFTLIFPGWHTLIAALLIIFGAAIMITESSENLETTRDLEGAG